MKKLELARGDQWAIDAPVIPTRSRLYHMTPIGIGTIDTECLSSYITRLAAAHCVSFDALINRVVAPIYYGGKITHRCRDGTSSNSKLIVSAFEELTKCYSIRYTNMSAWAGVIPKLNLLHRIRVWCPVCYEEWRHNGQVIYEPLLWKLAISEICFSHLVPLNKRCQHCGQEIRENTTPTRSGYCAKCHGWLGMSLKQWVRSSEQIDKEHLDKVIWSEKAVGELIAEAPNLVEFPQRTKIAQFFKECSEQITEGNASQLAHQLNVGDSLFLGWMSSTTMPTLPRLLSICFQLHVPPMRIFAGDYSLVSPEHTKPILDGNYLGNTHAINFNNVRQKLMLFLSVETEPPLPIKEIAKRLKMAEGTLMKYFPQLCQAIKDRYAAYAPNKRAKRMEERCHAVRVATKYLSDQGRYPSIDKVAELALGRSSKALSIPEVHTAWKETMKELGITLRAFSKKRSHSNQSR